MKRNLSRYGLAGATAALAAFITFGPARAQEPTCYPSYITLSGTCPDSCGRGPDCPCKTCVEVINQT